jgi:WD40 repeat protein
MKKNKIYQQVLIIISTIGLFALISGCHLDKNHQITLLLMKEHQITFSAKTHALDNNDNFSPDGNYLCYDTRGTVYNTDLANTKSIEKVEINSGIETILWNPPSVSGEQAAPGVAAVSWHPSEDKVIFIHGPFLDEVKSRGYYDKPNRTAMEVSADGKQKLTKVDMRDVITKRPTTPGTHRGGTHRHEYSRDGKRIGFTYDDFLLKQYDRTIGYLEIHPEAPNGYTHYFAILVKPTVKGQSKPGEIEKAYDDSWVDSAGRQRAFIAKIRSKNSVDYDYALCIVEIPENVDITSAESGTSAIYPEPPEGILFRRLTHSGWAGGIVRGSPDGKQIAYFFKDKDDVQQLHVIPVNGSDLDSDVSKQPRQLTWLPEDVSAVRWHPSGNWLFCLSHGNVLAIFIGSKEKFGKTCWLSQDKLEREQLVISPDGNTLAYIIRYPVKDKNSKNMKDVEGLFFRPIFTMNLDWQKLNQVVGSKTMSVE